MNVWHPAALDGVRKGGQGGQNEVPCSKPVKVVQGGPTNTFGGSVKL